MIYYFLYKVGNIFCIFILMMDLEKSETCQVLKL